MHISKIEIKNFRSIESLEVDCDKRLNVLVGKNNTGKSTILDAIRIALGSNVNNPNPIWITEDDFHQDFKSKERAQTFSITLEFEGLNENQRTKFFDIIDFNLSDLEKSTATIHFEASISLKNHARPIIKRRGRRNSNESPEINSELLNLFHIVYLPALRDAESALTSGTKNQLALLLQEIIPDEAESEIKEIASKRNQDLTTNEFITSISKKINAFTEEVADSDAQKATISAEEQNLLKILRQLQVSMTGEPISNLSANGLGLNNLLYMAVVSQYLDYKKEEDECPILLIEEPEAHLHPQILLALSGSFADHQQGVQSAQSFITTHSPTLVTDIPIKQIHLLYKRNSSISCNSLINVKLTELEMNQYRRMMDITRSTLYFAKGVILVEGISEALLIPVLAKKMGYNLRKKQISVIPICGTSFELFTKIFQQDVFNIPAAIITDADPKITYKDNNQSYQYANINPQDINQPCERVKKLLTLTNDSHHPLLKVFHSQVTLEYDLAEASSENPPIMAKAWENCFISKPQTLSVEIIEKFGEQKARVLCIWRVICLSKNQVGKGDFASRLAELIESSPTDSFVVPSYIKNAIEFVSNKVDQP